MHNLAFSIVHLMMKAAFLDVLTADDSTLQNRALRASLGYNVMLGAKNSIVRFDLGLTTSFLSRATTLHLALFLPSLRQVGLL